MAKFVQKGENIDYKNLTTETIRYGDVVVLGERIAIANADIQPGEVGIVAMTGVYQAPAETVEFTLGDKLYWSATDGKLTKTATGGIVAGLCIEEKVASISVAKVRL